MEASSRRDPFTDAAIHVIHELEKQPDTTESTTAPPAVAAVNSFDDGGVSKMEMENTLRAVLGLFKAFSVLSHSYLYMRLCMCIEHDKQPPISASDLKELAQLAQLILEMPIPDTSIMLRQEKPGSIHLQLFLSDSPMHPLVCFPWLLFIY
jgi:hypothetical protein